MKRNFIIAAAQAVLGMTTAIERRENTRICAVPADGQAKFSVRVGEFMFVARGTENHFCYRLPADRRLKTIMCRRKSVWSALAAKGWPTPKR